MTQRQLLVPSLILGALLLTAGLSEAASPTAADSGREVFAANCAMCHGQDATGMGDATSGRTPAGA